MSISKYLLARVPLRLTVEPSADLISHSQVEGVKPDLRSSVMRTEAELLGCLGFHWKAADPWAPAVALVAAVSAG